MKIKLGRQEFKYDNFKLLGNSGWRLARRAHDAALLTHISADSTLTFNLAGALNNDQQALFQNAFQGNNYKNLAFFWVNKQLEKSQVSLIFINRGLQMPDTTTQNTQTFGAFFSKDFNKVNLSGNYYHQVGTDESRRKVSAYMVSFLGTYSLSSQLKSSFGFDLLSGTDGTDLLDPNFNETNGFIPLYANRHRSFGLQDMFYAGNFDVVPGLLDIYVRGEYKFADKWKGDLGVHSFSTHKTQLNPETSNLVSNKNLGFEVDTQLAYKYNDSFSIQFVYTQYFGTEAMEVLKQRGDKNEITHFIYVSFKFKPILAIF